MIMEGRLTYNSIISSENGYARSAGTKKRKRFTVSKIDEY